MENKFNTIEEALEDLRQGKMIVVTDDPEREMKATLYVPASSRRQRMSISWLHTARD